MCRTVVLTRAGPVGSSPGEATRFQEAMHRIDDILHSLNSVLVGQTSARHSRVPVAR